MFEVSNVSVCESRLECSVRRSDVHNLDVELKDRIGGNLISHGSVTICVVRWAKECSLGTLSEAKESLVPTLDNLTSANLKGQRLAPIVASVKLGAIKESSTIVGVHFVTLLELVAFTLLGHSHGELRLFRRSSLG